MIEMAERALDGRRCRQAGVGLRSTMITSIPSCRAASIFA